MIVEVQAAYTRGHLDTAHKQMKQTVRLSDRGMNMIGEHQLGVQHHT